MKAVCGIDPGLDGGFAIIGQEGVLIEPMPTVGDRKGRLIDLPTVYRWLKANKAQIEVAYIETIGIRPMNSKGSILKVGRGFGQLEGLLSALEIPYTLVGPHVWTKVMHVGIAGEMHPKDRSKVAVARLFPQVDLRKSLRCSTPHDGMMDALLIAAYGLRQRTHA